MKIISELLVNDVNNSIKFYKDFLGFEIVETTGNPINWARLKRNSAEIMIESYKSAINEFKNFPQKAKASNLIKFKYDDIADVKDIYKNIINSNVKIFKDLKQTNYGTTEFAILDIDDNIIIISD